MLVTAINSLKQHTMATHLPASDNNDTLPWPNWAEGARLDRPGWLYTLDASATGSARFKVQTGLFWPVLHDPKLFFSPRRSQRAKVRPAAAADF